MALSEMLGSEIICEDRGESASVEGVHGRWRGEYAIGRIFSSSHQFLRTTGGTQNEIIHSPIYPFPAPRFVSYWRKFAERSHTVTSIRGRRRQRSSVISPFIFEPLHPSKPLALGVESLRGRACSGAMRLYGKCTELAQIGEGVVVEE